MPSRSIPDTPRAFSPKEVALQLGLCTRTVLNHINEGRFKPIYRINQRVIRIPQEAIDNYLADIREHLPDTAPPAAIRAKAS